MSKHFTSVILSSEIYLFFKITWLRSKGQITSKGGEANIYRTFYHQPVSPTKATQHERNSTKFFCKEKGPKQR